MVEQSETLVVMPIRWVNTFFSGWVAKIIVAVLILLIGFILGKLVEKFARRLLREIEFNAIIRKVFNLKAQFEEIAVKSITYIVYFIAIVTALNRLGITRTVLYIVSGGVALLLTAYLALGIKDFIPNALAGIFRKQSFKVGDKIVIGNIRGKVIKIRINEVGVETNDKDLIYIPNSHIKNSKVIVRKG